MHFLFFFFSFQLTTASFLRLFGLEKSSQIEPQDTCIDSDIHDVCLTTCRLQYLECLASCNDSSYCESQCRLNFASCDASCPCGVDCPLGCERCDHPLCDDCKDAEISNDDYKMCVVFALDKQNDCIKQCPPNLNCMDQCYADYRINVQSCPCIESENLTTTGYQYPTRISTTTPMTTPPTTTPIISTKSGIKSTTIGQPSTTPRKTTYTTTRLISTSTTTTTTRQWITTNTPTSTITTTTTTTTPTTTTTTKPRLLPEDCINFCGRLNETTTCDGGQSPEYISSCPSRDDDCFSCPDDGTCLLALNGIGPEKCSEILAFHDDPNIRTLCSDLSCLH